MERDVAIRIDGMLMGVLAALDGVAHYMKNNLTEHEFKSIVTDIGRSMSAIADLSNNLHSDFPDIIPKELIPTKKT